MKTPFSSIRPTAQEVRAVCAGDHVVSDADSVMDRAFTIRAAPELVWPWLVQLGKQRAGWYLPVWAERFVPRSHRAIRRIDSRWQELKVGDVIPDYGGRDETFQVVVIQAPTVLVYRSRRGGMNVSWSITLAERRIRPGVLHTRVHLRLRLGPVGRKWLVDTGGELIDLVTVAGLAAGLQERVEPGAH